MSLITDLGEQCRGDVTRTHDPHVPNVVRYQLRYTPKIKNFKNIERCTPQMAGLHPD
jgi:hypothetical protein